MNITKDMIADIIINISNILILYFVVRFLVYKPVKKFMSARTERIYAAKAEADKLADEAEQKNKRCDNLIKESEKAKEEAVKQGEAIGRDEAQRLIDDANHKADSIVENANKKALAEHDRMIEKAKEEVVVLALQISSKLLAREVTDADNKKIVESFLGSDGKGDNDA